MQRLLSGEIFHPPEHTTTTSSLNGFEFIPAEVKRKMTSERNASSKASNNELSGSNTKEKEKEKDNNNNDGNNSNNVPIIYREWKGRQGENAWVTIIYSGGFEEDLGLMSLWLDHIKDSLNVNILAYENTGYGLNKGKPSEKECYKCVRAAYNWLITTKDVHPERIILMGRSLGTACVIDLASKLYSTEGFSSHGNSFSIAESLKKLNRTFSGGASQIEKPAGQLFKGLAGMILISPMSSLHGLKSDDHPAILAMTDMFENSKKITKVRCPTLIIHGTVDNIIDISNAKKLNDILGPSFATFREVEGASHFDLTTNYADDVLDSCATFVNSLQPDQYLESKAKAGAIIPDQYSSSPSLIVGRWLTSLGMQKYSDKFLCGGYFDAASLAQLTTTDLDILGITDDKERQLFLEASKKLQENGLNVGGAPPTTLYGSQVSSSSSLSSTVNPFDTNAVGRKESVDSLPSSASSVAAHHQIYLQQLNMAMLNSHKDAGGSVSSIHAPSTPQSSTNSLYNSNNSLNRTPSSTPPHQSSSLTPPDNKHDEKFTASRKGVGSSAASFIKRNILKLRKGSFSEHHHSNSTNNSTNSSPNSKPTEVKDDSHVLRTSSGSTKTRAARDSKTYDDSVLSSVLVTDKRLKRNKHKNDDSNNNNNNNNNNNGSSTSTTTSSKPDATRSEEIYVQPKKKSKKRESQQDSQSTDSSSSYPPPELSTTITTTEKPEKSEKSEKSESKSEKAEKTASSGDGTMKKRKYGSSNSLVEMEEEARTRKSSSSDKKKYGTVDLAAIDEALKQQQSKIAPAKYEVVDGPVPLVAKRSSSKGTEEELQASLTTSKRSSKSKKTSSATLQEIMASPPPPPPPNTTTNPKRSKQVPALGLAALGGELSRSEKRLSFALDLTGMTTEKEVLHEKLKELKDHSDDQEREMDRMKRRIGQLESSSRVQTQLISQLVHIIKVQNEKTKRLSEEFAQLQNDFDEVVDRLDQVLAAAGEEEEEEGQTTDQYYDEEQYEAEGELETEQEVEEEVPPVVPQKQKTVKSNNKPTSLTTSTKSQAQRIVQQQQQHQESETSTDEDKPKPPPRLSKSSDSSVTKK